MNTTSWFISYYFSFSVYGVSYGGWLMRWLVFCWLLHFGVRIIFSVFLTAGASFHNESLQCGSFGWLAEYDRAKHIPAQPFLIRPLGISLYYFIMTTHVGSHSW